MNRTATLVGSLALLTLVGIARGQTGYTITGAMSNFDCVNRCDYPCDEIEIQVEGIRPEDVLHTYRNGNYGSPTVTLSPDGGSTIIDYRGPGHPTPVGTIERFGVTIRGAAYYAPAVYHPTRVRWFRDGHPATVHGLVPTPGGTTAPATQPLQPSIGATVTPGSSGHGGVSLTVVNNDTQQSVWVRRRAQVTSAPVTLEALMPTDPVVTTTVQIDSSPVKIAPGQTLTVAHDLIEIEEDQSVVFTANYFQNVVVSNPDPFDPSNGETVGPELGNIMTATLASPIDPCVHHPASIVEQPASISQPAGSRVDLRVRAQGDDTAPLEYQWYHEGAVLTDGPGVSGATTAHLRVDELTPAAQGFYYVRVSNPCISTYSDSALVFINGVNTAPTHGRQCPGDYDNVGGRTVGDVFLFLSDWFAGLPGADIDRRNGVGVNDIFEFLGEWFRPC